MVHLSRRSSMKATGALGAAVLPTRISFDSDFCHDVCAAKAATAPSPGSFSKYREDVSGAAETRPQLLDSPIPSRGKMKWERPRPMAGQAASALGNDAVRHVKAENVERSAEHPPNGNPRSYCEERSRTWRVLGH